MRTFIVLIMFLYMAMPLAANTCMGDAMSQDSAESLRDRFMSVLELHSDANTKEVIRSQLTSNSLELVFVSDAQKVADLVRCEDKNYFRLIARFVQQAPDSILQVLQINFAVRLRNMQRPLVRSVKYPFF